MITLWGQKGVLDHSRGLEYRGGEGKSLIILRDPERGVYCLNQTVRMPLSSSFSSSTVCHSRSVLCSMTPALRRLHLSERHLLPLLRGGAKVVQGHLLETRLSLLLLYLRSCFNIRANLGPEA